MLSVSADVICPCTVHILSSYHTLTAQCGVTAQSINAFFCDEMTCHWRSWSPNIVGGHRAFTLNLSMKVSEWSAASGTVSPDTQTVSQNL